MAKAALTDSPTKDRLLEAAEKLMLAQGYAATTVDEICEAAKLTKGSFFHYFESKEHLGRELLERFCRHAGEQMRSAVGGVDVDPLRRVYAFIDFGIKMAAQCGTEQGCLLGTFAQELSETNPAMRDQCAKAFARWAQWLKQDLDAAKAKHAPKAAIDTQSLADHFIAIMEGAKILAKAKRDPSIEEQSLGHLRRYVQSLFERTPR
ncbi:MAG: TetR/AcrR family transcriptional regulator [Candidatus Omnitrophica bacterium]|nr:TetR/AcrR family transcriptional regulator [Candidatus Omnitrophota bacterium]